MTAKVTALTEYQERLKRWFFSDNRQNKNPDHTHKHPWWQVMCLTGVDYFSTLGYQPGIAAVAAGALSPIATLILILLTLFGALPIYRMVARASPHGEGSISMLEHLLPWWQGKLLVLCLLGFVATDFIITITLSAADATAHIIENPFISEFWRNQSIPITVMLVLLLGGVFLKGFREAIGLAVFLVVIYLGLNLVTIAYGMYQIYLHPQVITNWQSLLFVNGQNWWQIIGTSVLIFPKLALGLSGFETGVAVMPLVKGHSQDTEEQPIGRVQNTYKLLTAAALIMSLFLLTSSLVTTLLIPAEQFGLDGKAKGRALAYLTHLYFGDTFGTIYDLSTITILWFAGASAMAGLINIVPRYLPRYGMAPNWALVTRPLVVVYTVIALLVTIIFQANVEAQGGAYATGVLVLMSSAALAVALMVQRQGLKKSMFIFGTITLIFIYTTVTNIIERPEGIKIAGLFITGIIITSLVSRVWRSTELRVENITMDETAQQFIDLASTGVIRIISHRPNQRTLSEYALKENSTRDDHHIPPSDPVLFLEIQISDPSEFAGKIHIEGIEIGKYRILRAQGAAVPNTIAAILLHIRNITHKLPHAYFGWAEGNPFKYLMRFILFGEGDIAVVSREVLRKAEKNPQCRPVIHVGG